MKLLLWRSSLWMALIADWGLMLAGIAAAVLP